MTPLLLCAALSLAPAGADATPEGVWEGSLKVQAGIELRLVVHVAKADGGQFKATLDSPDQGAKGLKVDSIEAKDGTLTFKMKRRKGYHKTIGHRQELTRIKINEIKA